MSNSIEDRTWTCHILLLLTAHSHNLVTWPHRAFREAGKYSLCLADIWPAKTLLLWKKES